MKIYTGNFANLKKYQSEGLFSISIARFNRYYKGAEMKQLAPPSWLINYPEAKYIPEYEKILKTLNRESVLKSIETLSGGRNVVLLCYERAGEFCHRQLVAKWLSEIIEVKEFEIKKVKQTDYSKLDVFYWLCTKHHDQADGRDGTCYEIIGYDLCYMFKLGEWSLKEGKNRFVQKHGSRI